MAYEYNFYIQKYTHNFYQEGIVEPKGKKIDIEETFNCKYVSLSGVSENGKVKNIYTESYAETEELRTYIPKDLVYDNTELVLTLLFVPTCDDDEADIQDNADKFFNYVSGRKIEWSDTFRNKFVTMVLINKPEVVGEVLYGGSRYRQIKYTFKNIFGRSFDKSQIE